MLLVLPLYYIFADLSTFHAKIILEIFARSPQLILYIQNGADRGAVHHAKTLAQGKGHAWWEEVDYFVAYAPRAVLR